MRVMTTCFMIINSGIKETIRKQFLASHLCNVDLVLFSLYNSCCRFELAMQQNEIVDIFFDDWMNLGDDDGTFGVKSDTHLKVKNPSQTSNQIPTSPRRSHQIRSPRLNVKAIRTDPHLSM